MLDWIADDLETSQSDSERDAKGKGRAPQKPGKSAASSHGDLRFTDSFTLPQLISEFRALRASVIRLWTKDRKVANEAQLADLGRFNEAIDECIAESVVTFWAGTENSRDMFDAILGHDLRNPLNAIVMGAAQLSARSDTGTANHAAAVSILKSSDQMRRLITDVLDFSQHRLGGAMPVFPVEMDMAELCREVVQELLIAMPDRQVTVEAQGDVRGFWDRDRIAQAISNLVSNALRHGASNSAVSVSVKGEGDEIVLTVHNWGAVISTEHFSTLFDPTRRFSSGVGPSTYEKGIGIGLLIAQQVVSAHGGTIDVASSTQTGTIFTMRLPRRSEATGDQSPREHSLR